MNMTNVDIPELVPMDDYDAKQARLESSIRWLMGKAFHGDSSSAKYEDVSCISDMLASIAPDLTSSEIYWSALEKMFPEVKGQLRGHIGIIQFLLRNGIDLPEIDDAQVSVAKLQKNSPLDLRAHLALIDGLMTAFLNSTLAPDKVVPAVRKFSTFSASKEFPMNAEDSVVFWVNKACAALCQHLQSQGHVTPIGLTLADVKDVTDGRCLAALISFYCPTQLLINTVEMGDSLGIADSLYNLQMALEVCRKNFPSEVSSMSVMDFFYAPEALRLNLLAFFADLFYHLVVEKLPCSRDTGQPLTLTMEEPKMQAKSRLIIPEISNATKQSFHRTASANSQQTTANISGAFTLKQPLLPKRHAVDSRSSAVCNSEFRQPAMEAWVHNNNNTTSTTDSCRTGSTSLLSNVELDNSLNFTTLDYSLQSIDQMPASDRSLKKTFDDGSYVDPLFPAELQPAKEKTNNHSKNYEYGEQRDRRKDVATTPRDRNCQNGDDSREVESRVSDSSTSTTPSDGYKTPSIENIPKSNDLREDVFHDVVVVGDRRSSEKLDLDESGELERDRLGSRSYIIRGHPASAEDAAAAGIPVVGDNLRGLFPLSTDVRDDGGSNSSSDQELHKLRADSRDKESRRPLSTTTDERPSYSSEKPPLDRQQQQLNRATSCVEKTSFAQIKKQKEAEEQGSKILRETGTPSGGVTSENQCKGGLLGVGRPKKRTTFGVLPNQTTWKQESVQRNTSERSVDRNGSNTTFEPMPSELFGLRMKLEENRRQIENRKRVAERHWNQQRQQMGKEAFIQVITKNKVTGEIQVEQNLVSTNDESTKETKNKSTTFIVGLNENEDDVDEQDSNRVPVESLSSNRVPVESLSSNRVPVESLASNRVPVESLASNSRVPLDRFTPNTANGVPVESPALRGRGSSSGVPNEEKQAEHRLVLDDVTKRVDSRNDENDFHVGLSQRKLNEERTSESGKNVKYDDTSLNRITNSLSELQGEILRLSQQQTEINNLVRSDLTQSGRISTSDQQQQNKERNTKQQFFIQPSFSDRLNPGIFENDTGLQQSRPIASPYSVPSYPPLATTFPQRYHASPSLPLSMGHFQQPFIPSPPQISHPTDRIYPQSGAGQQYVSLGAQFHTQGMYPTMMPGGMYPMAVPTSYQGTQYPGPPMTQQQQFHPAMVPRQDFVGSYASPPHSLQTFNNFSSPHESYAAQNAPNSFYSTGWPVSQTAALVLQHSTMTTENANQEQDGSTHDIENKEQKQEERRTSVPASDDVKPNLEKERKTKEESEGFFIDIGATATATPQRLKPIFKVDITERKNSGECDDDVIEAYPSAEDTASEKMDADANASSPQIATTEQTENPVVFVIGRSTENENDWMEMEKRKQRLAEIQMKRLEEKESRKDRLEKEQEKKREQQRLKQEMAEQKRAEDKARRDAIYQKYLQKKLEDEGLEEKPPVAPPPVVRRNKGVTPKSARPKSQPALANEVVSAGGFVGVAGYYGHNSQDNLVSGGVCQSPASDQSRSSERVNYGEAPLAFGGLTHRATPPTPDPIVRFAPMSTLNGGAEGLTAENYAGPKLFVKPSQKSNRHIIINAISHCCLAGTVNKEVKNKVLEEVAKSDSKHFIILFRDAGMQYRGLYTFNPDQNDEIIRIQGQGPKLLTDKVMEKFYKYNSGSKTFSEVTSTKHLSATIDAITVLSTVWQKTKPLGGGPTKKPA